MPSASEAPANDDNAGGKLSGAEMDNSSASGASGVNRGSGEKVTTHPARIVPGDKVGLLSNGRTVSVSNELMRDAISRTKLFRENDIVTVTLSADCEVESIVLERVRCAF